MYMQERDKKIVAPRENTGPSGTKEKEQNRTDVFTLDGSKGLKRNGGRCVRYLNSRSPVSEALRFNFDVS